MTRKKADWTMTTAGRGVRLALTSAATCKKHTVIFQHLINATTSLTLMSCHDPPTPLRLTAACHCLPPETPQSYPDTHALPALNPPRPQATHRKHHSPSIANKKCLVKALPHQRDGRIWPNEAHQRRLFPKARPTVDSSRRRTKAPQQDYTRRMLSDMVATPMLGYHHMARVYINCPS